VCSFCDFTNHYIFESGECKKVERPNCKISDTNGNCLRCEGPYFANEVCIEVDSIAKDSNCVMYESSNSCLICAPGFYSNSGSCAKAVGGGAVTNCKINLRDTC